jgi:hypothetical protein
MSRIMSIGLVFAGLISTAAGCTANVEDPKVDQTGREGDTCVTSCDDSHTTCVAKCSDDTCKGSCQTTLDDCKGKCD